jgi:hypothetical protein
VFGEESAAGCGGMQLMSVGSALSEYALASLRGSSAWARKCATPDVVYHRG